MKKIKQNRLFGACAGQLALALTAVMMPLAAQANIDYRTINEISHVFRPRVETISLSASQKGGPLLATAYSFRNAGRHLVGFVRTGLINKDPDSQQPPVSIFNASDGKADWNALRLAAESHWMVARFADKEEAPDEASTRPAFDAASPQGVFLDKVWEHAQEAAEDVGVPAMFIIAQAALETGWGRAQLVGEDGRQSHNLFNIKAGRNWTGKTVEVRVREYEKGRPVIRKAAFRAYDSYRDAFIDYARLLKNNERYAQVLGEDDPSQFAYGLQRAGFATDPSYGKKIVAIIKHIERESQS